MLFNPLCSCKGTVSVITDICIRKGLKLKKKKKITYYLKYDKIGLKPFWFSCSVLIPGLFVLCLEKLCSQCAKHQTPIQSRHTHKIIFCYSTEFTIAFCWMDVNRFWRRKGAAVLLFVRNYYTVRHRREIDMPYASLKSLTIYWAVMSLTFIFVDYLNQWANRANLY